MQIIKEIRIGYFRSFSQKIEIKQIKDLNHQEQSINLTLNDESNINTKLVIASDGANSFIRQRGGFNVTKWDYDQIAVVTTLKLAPVLLEQNILSRVSIWNFERINKINVLFFFFFIERILKTLLHGKGFYLLDQLLFCP